MTYSREKEIKNLEEHIEATKETIRVLQNSILDMKHEISLLKNYPYLIEIKELPENPFVHYC